MPSISNHTINVTTVGTEVKIDVTYTVHFGRLEGNLVGFGLVFAEFFEIIGVDPPGSFTGRTLVSGNLTQLPVVHQNAGQVLHRAHTFTVPRAWLDEDPDLVAPDADEIRCRITISSNARDILPTPLAVVTDQVVLAATGGGVEPSLTKRKPRRTSR